MTIDDFLTHTIQHSNPEPDWSPALQALWHAENGNWDTAHTLCQEGESSDGAWVHANLHREEGDLSNARYWYSRADKPESNDSIEAERHHIIQALLN